MAADAAGTSVSVSGSVVDGKDALQSQRVRCMVHNFPDNDDDDAESTIRALLEPDVIVQHCQPSTTGLYDYSITVATRLSPSH